MAKQGYFTRGKIEFWVLFLVGVMFVYVYETQNRKILRLEQQVVMQKVEMLIKDRPDWFDLERSHAGGKTDLWLVTADFYVGDEKTISQIRELVQETFTAEELERIVFVYYVNGGRVRHSVGVP